jgi:hypothetical protein
VEQPNPLPVSLINQLNAALTSCDFHDGDGVDFFIALLLEYRPATSRFGYVAAHSP